MALRLNGADKFRCRLALGRRRRHGDKLDGAWGVPKLLAVVPASDGLVHSWQ